MTTPEEHIAWALEIEKQVPKEEKELYLECMNNVPMSARNDEQSIHDGCILTNLVYLHCSAKHPLK